MYSLSVQLVATHLFLGWVFLHFNLIQINFSLKFSYCVAIRNHCVCVYLKALKILRTSEFLPYVVFIEAPDFEVLKAMNRSAIESGVITKQLTVSWNESMTGIQHYKSINIWIKVHWQLDACFLLSIFQVNVIKAHCPKALHSLKYKTNMLYKLVLFQQWHL